jgi:hypothetical protein
MYTIAPPKPKKRSLWGGGGSRGAEDLGYRMIVHGPTARNSRNSASTADKRDDGEEDDLQWRPGAEGRIVYEIPGGLPITGETLFRLYKKRKKSALGFGGKSKKKLYIWVHSSFVARAAGSTLGPGRDDADAGDEAEGTLPGVPSTVSKDVAREYSAELDRAAGGDGETDLWDEGKWEAAAKDADGCITRSQWLAIVREREPGVNALCKLEIDGCHKDFKHKKYPAGFGVDLVCQGREPDPGVTGATKLMVPERSGPRRVFLPSDEERAAFMRRAREFGQSSGAGHALAKKVGSEIAMSFRRARGNGGDGGSLADIMATPAGDVSDTSSDEDGEEKASKNP